MLLSKPLMLPVFSRTDYDTVAWRRVVCCQVDYYCPSSHCYYEFLVPQASFGPRIVVLLFVFVVTETRPNRPEWVCRE